MTASNRIRGIASAVLVLAGIGVGATGVVTAHAGSRQLIYMCQQQPCKNAQEFEVFDPNGAPIFSVGEFGGDGVFGDNRNVFNRKDVFHPALVESFTTPALYGSKSCAAPAVWIAPQGIWACKAGTWVKKLSF